MSITISIRFTNGQYHATPWGNHANEGLVEWPPSPWRLLRSLIAVGFAKQNWGDDIQTIPASARSLLNKLSACLPSYLLPVGAVAHTRHYMPLYDSTKRDCAKVLDAFVRIAESNSTSSQLLKVYWPVDLNESEVGCLENLVCSMAYLGRRESWIEASLDEDTSEPDDNWVKPVDMNDCARQGWDQISLYAPVEQNYYSEWLKRQPKPQKKSKALKLPEDILGCLCLSTSQWRDANWSQPPGSRKVYYWRKSDALEPAAAQVSFVKSHLEPVECVLLALTSDTVKGTVRPLLTDALMWMEKIHKAAVEKLTKTLNEGEKCDCPCLIGKDRECNPLKGPHQHACYLPLDLDGDKRIDHVLVYAAMKLDEQAQRALMSIRTIYATDCPAMIVSVAGVGSLQMMRKQLKDRWGKTPSVICKSKVWECYTPFIAPRFIHKSGNHSIEDQVRKECASRGLPAPVKITIQREPYFFKFVCSRKEDDKQPPCKYPLSVRIEFENEVNGPICLGYASHYGLGLFKACRE